MSFPSDDMGKAAARVIVDAVSEVAELSGSSHLSAAQAVFIGSMKIIRCESGDMKEAVETILKNVELFMSHSGMEVHVIESNKLN